MEALEIVIDDSVTPRVLGIAGEIDMATVDQLRAALGRALADDPTTVVDLGGVTFLGAAGMHAFLGAASELNGSGPLRFVRAQRLAWLLDLVGLNAVTTVEICDAG